MLVKNTIKASSNANCLEFEAGMCSSVFDLKNKKTSAPLVESDQGDGDEDDSLISELCEQLNNYELSDFQSAVLGYMGGFVACKLRKKINYETCLTALTDHSQFQHTYAGVQNPSYQLISLKNGGGLKPPSKTVVKLVEVCERAFRILIAGEGHKSLPRAAQMKKLTKSVFRFNQDIQFPGLDKHDLENVCENSELHSTQLKKKVCESFLKTRLLCYGQSYYTEVIQAGKFGKRQHLNKTVLFESL